MSKEDAMDRAAALHDRYEELAEVFLCDGLAGEELEAFEEHLEACESCRDRLEQDEAFEAFVAGCLRDGQAPDDLEERLVRGFRATIAGEPARKVIAMPRTPMKIWFLRASKALGAAAAIILLVTLGARLTREKPFARGGWVATVQPETQPMLGDMTLAHEVPRLSLATVPVVGTLFTEGLEVNQTGKYHFNADGATFAWHATATPQAPETETGIRGGEGGGGAGRFGLLAGLSEIPDGPGVTDGRGDGSRDKRFDEGKAPEEVTSKENSGAATRSLVRRAEVDVEVEDFDRAVARVTRLAADLGGYVEDASSRRLPNGKRQGHLVLRVPPGKLDLFLAGLRGDEAIGEVKSQSLSAEDVTLQVADVDARLRNARKLEERLLKLIDRKEGEVKDLLQVERELGEVRERIERLEASQKALKSLVSLASVTMTLAEKDLKRPAFYKVEREARLSCRVPDVEAAEVKARSALEEVKGRVVSAQVRREASGVKRAHLLLEVPASAFTQMLSRLEGLGEVTDFQAVRQEVAQGGSGSADGELKREERSGRINLVLYDERGIVPEGTGLGTAIRRALAQSFDQLVWSARMVAVSLGFLAPWAILLVPVAWWLRRRRRRRAAAREAATPEQGS